YFEIGDGQTYDPFTLEKLQKWAASGNLMPTHRVRRADSSEWTIAAYVPGLELTTQVTGEAVDASSAPVARKPKGLKDLVRSRKSSSAGGDAADGDASQAALKVKGPPNIVGLVDEILEIAYERHASDIHIDPEENVTLVQIRVDGELENLKKLP
ncbi:MAG: DUF4339 domain-containing protein, partial [Planctomycetales bacterium]|nr:DUF4339 domain-containing protein [Planctomycetales bacterium]